jgi:HAD superfamily hydrolase (TIGR01484 family)
MPLPVICFDLDGTLIDPQGCIHPQDAALLMSDNPKACHIPTTGRSLDGVKSNFAKFGIFKGSILPFPLVMQNGALLYHPGEVFAAHFPFEPGLQTALIQLAEGFPNVCSFFLDINEIHVMWANPFGLEAAQQYQFTTCPFTAASRKHSFSKLMFLSPDHDALRAIASAGESLPLQGVFSMETIYEFPPSGITKASGVKTILKMLGMEDVAVYAAGDGENDLEMLRMADVSFAPSTSPAVVQVECDHIIDVRREGLLRPILRTAGLLP